MKTSSSPRQSSTTKYSCWQACRPLKPEALAQQADGSAAVYLDGDTMLLSATTAQKTPREAIDFFPLTVDVEEKMYAVGRIPSSLPPGGSPSENAILSLSADRPARCARPS